MNFTAEQAQAIFTHDQNLIVVAGAGSGKTWVLVQRYLSLLELHPTWNLPEIVAITFTEKAAREMRERVRDALREKVQTAQDEESLRRWQAQENLLDQARIGTIHSLCAQLLRANPAQVPVDPAFQVLDENEAYLLKAEAVEEALSRLIETPAGDLFLTYGVNQIRQTLLSFAERSASEGILNSVPADSAQLIENWEALYFQTVTKWVDQIHQDEWFWDNLQWIPSTGVWASSDDKRQQVWDQVHSLMGNLSLKDPQQVFQTLEAIRLAINLRGGSAKNWGGEAIWAESKAALENIRAGCLYYYKTCPTPIADADHTSANLLILWREAVKLAMETYQDYKTDRAVLDFDDLEVLTLKLLQEYPAVAERYAQGAFQQIMVDEFQDTNERQREMIYRLCGLTASQTPQGRLFVVGDPKQSIYAFRGADVSVFQAVQADLVGRGGGEVPLSRSFRTHDRLVEGMNQIFEQLLVSAGRGFEVNFGQAMTAQRPVENFHDVPMTLLSFPKTEGYESTDELRRWEAYEIAQRIHALVEHQTLIYDKKRQTYRPIEYGDVAILFRSLSPAHLYEDVFKAQGLPYITIAGRGYYNRQEVWDVLNLLKALHNRADNLALASVLRSPMFGLSDDALLILRLYRNETGERLPLWEALQNLDSLPYPLSEEDQTAAHFAQIVLNRLAGLAGRVRVDSLIETALDDTAYDAILTALPDGNRRRGNLEKLLEKARQSGRVSLSEFMLYVRDLTSIEPREGEALVDSSQAVQLMTVHRSKGLEFPLVVIPNATWSRRAQDTPALLYDPDLGAACLIRDENGDKIPTLAYEQARQLSAERDLAESKRLLYVAMTRAQDYLWITGATGKEKEIAEDNPKTWYEMLQAALQGNPHLQEDGFILVETPPQAPTLAQLWGEKSTASAGWDVMSQKSANPTQPPLLSPLTITPLQQVRHLSVSQLEQLGSLPYYRPEWRGKRAFRQSVLHDAPLPIRRIEGRELSDQVRARTVGLIVHRALQVQAQKHPADQLQQILAAYAWKEGITAPDEVEPIVRQAQTLLRDYEQAEPLALRHAEQILREVPFIYPFQGRILHGTIDVLYQSGGEWFILDYKTALIRSTSAQWHARRYAVQLGAYAQAVQDRWGSSEPPQVQIYYLHTNQLVDLARETWQQALAQLDVLVDNALADLD